MYDKEYFEKIGEEETLQADLLARLLMEKFHPSSVIDMGCATGLYLKWFHEFGVDVLGVDNSEVARSIAVIPESKIVIRDLSQRWYFHVFGITICLEVVEHIDPEFEDIVLGNITAPSDILAFSAAVPGQGGEGHVNCRPKRYWAQKMEDRGFYLDRKSTAEIIDRLRDFPGTLGWLINNLLIFRRDKPRKRGIVILNEQPESDVTAAVLSCGRPDLLERTMKSLLLTIDEPVKTIILDDSESTISHQQIVDQYGSWADIYIPGKSHGHAWALDRLFELVDTKYVFACEDDWEFLRPGYLQVSREILESRPDVGTVGIVLDDELCKHGAADLSIAYHAGHAPYHDHPRWRISDQHDWWNGWIGSPNLKRMEDVHNLGPFMQAKTEAEWDREIWAKSGLRSVWLAEQYARHIGARRSVWPSNLKERDWTRPARMQYPWVQFVSSPPTFRFHLLGLAHIPTHREYSMCAYTQKVLKLSKMLTDNGHEVILYAGEGSEAECTELVEVVSEEDRIQAYGEYDWRSEFFRHDPGDHAYQTFNRNAAGEILRRRQDGDFLLITFGNYQKPTADAVGILPTVESGIGYSGIFAKYRVFESYAWMHYLYGMMQQNNGSWYDCVIPNYFDPADFPMGDHSGDYCLYIGRIILRKGVQVAVQVAEEIGARLIVAGQGSLKNEIEGLDIQSDCIDFVGSVGPEERARLMGDARVAFVPTYYIEPFGGVAVEAQMCGCPVITTDWGAFTETVVHGVTGFRCRTFNEFVHAAREAMTEIDPEMCRRWAISNYSMKAVYGQYEAYFRALVDLRHPRGWYSVHEGWSNKGVGREYLPIIT